ncbi:MAG TPA: protein kinase [Vicinamibacterales bacterium]|nr:protein kinase [Vicinamibacterales bacterium]
MTDRWCATERIFHAALERPVEARAAFVAEACGDDVELRRDVQSLLDEASSAGFLEQPALQIAAGLVTSAGIAPLTGQRIGIYSITALLGRGGMGEVYRAHDTRLGRDVAIKVLPQAVTANPDRLARFEREARVLASLNHPHIGMLYGLEESGGHSALVLELVEGETLAERLARGPVPLKQALTWARQIADALDAAHEKGIVHRDLKPANVKITPQDVVKVLDFGLARTFESGSGAGPPVSPTITVEAGLVIGTAAYMSPEQARGEPVDRRADVWAFGCVLYELLTGRLAFAAATIPDTLATVLHQDPDWTALPSGLPPALATLLRRCLEKDVRQRRRDMGDVRAELDDAFAQPAVATPPADAADSRLRRLLPLAATAAALVAAAAVGAWTARRSSPVAPDAGLRQIMDLVGIEEMPALSPDGKDIVFVATVDGRRQIWLRRLGGGSAQQITRDAVDHDYPRWTHDSSAIVYFTPADKEGDAGTLWEIPAFGGTAARKVAQAITGADVSHDGLRIATFQKVGDGLALTILDRDGARVKTATVAPALEYFTPRWSPDDRSIAFIANEGNLRNVIYVTDTSRGTTREIHSTTALKGLAWLPDGSGLVYGSAAGSTLRYPPVFNLRSVSRDGGNDRQLTIGDESYVDPEIVQPGRIFASRIRMHSDIWRFPISGSAAENVRNGTQVTRQTAHVQTPSASPDGKEIAYLSNSGGQGNVWVAKTDGTGTARALTFESDPAFVVGVPIWSPRGDWIGYIRTARTGQSSQWLVKPDGSDRHQLTNAGTGAVWSHDGRWVYFTIFSAGGSSCIYRVPVEGGDRARIRCDASNPSVSSDGATLYYSPRTAHAEIFKASPPDGEGIGLHGYARARVPWYPTGHTLSPDDRWIAAPLKDGATTNIWAMPTDGGPMRQITDFGRRAVLIARTVSWSSDSQSVYAAVAEMDADIVLLEGIRQPSR